MFEIIFIAVDIVVLAEQKLMSYVYAVGKQPTGNLWYKMVERGGATVKCGNDKPLRVLLIMYITLYNKQF